MNGPATMIGGAAAVAFGFATTYTAMDFGEVEKPPAIEVRDIRIWSDGSTNYDRETEDGVWLAWSGQIFKADGSLHCRGGGTSQYFDDANPLAAKDVGWLVDASCSEGLTEGMTWVFTWTPLDSDYGIVRYPAEGYGAVLPPA